ncbi:MAG: hypothetical protein LBO74_09800 [Candidatus Symbiothrix sp.]|jgi:hypothetical protein|nr:hypothetical protein [Candidatus Symbiothrix sp.]
MRELIEQYNALNNSFQKKLVFHLGADAGFFSEYNNMILALLYCLENKIKFTLYSKDANFGYDKGWTDYFLPFCEEEDSRFHAKYNFRYPGIFKKWRPQVIIYHLFNRNSLLTFEVMNQARNRQLEQTHFYIPEVGIDGSLQDACRTLIDLTWRYNPQTQHKVEQLITSLHLPENYTGFHIRSGDKSKEAALLDVAKYTEKAQRYSPTPNAFVLTDDYRIIEDFRSQMKVWTVYTLCKKEERGYFHTDFQKKDTGFIRESHENLLASMDILSKSNIFVGTFSSNPGMYLGMRMPAGTAFGVDLEQWQIW